MAGVTNKRPKVVLVKKDSVDQAGVFLDSLPEKPREDFSLRAAVDRLREPIRAALSKGYTYEEVAELLADQGIKISPSTLKNYVPSGTRQSSKDKSATTSNGRKTKKSDDETLSLLDEPTSASETAPLSEPEDAPVADEEPTPTKRRTKSTAAKAKTEPSTSTKPAAKTRSSASKPAASKSVGKPATGAKSRSRTTTKK